MRVPAAVAGSLGGLCWLAAYVADRVDAATALIDALTWAGVALLAIAVLAAGAGLVKSSAGWLRMIVAVGFAALVGSVLQVVRDGGDPLVIDAVVGALALVVSLTLLARRREDAPVARDHAPPARRSRGSHAR